MAITGLIPQTKMPIDTFNSQLEQLMQQIARHRQTNNQARQIEETAKYHAQDMALRQAAGKRAQQQMDPMFKVNQIKAMIEGLRGMANGNQQANGDMGGEESMPGMPPSGADNSDNPGVSAEGPGVIPEGQNPFVGRAGYKPPKQQGPDEQHPMDNEIMPGITLEDITRHMMGLPAKKAPIETPAAKQERLLKFNQAKLEQKEQFDKAKELRKIDSEIPLTNAMKTQMQNIISGVPKVIKKIDSLIAAPSPTTLVGYKPNERAEHSALVLETAESYAKAKGWPNTNESIKAAAKVLDRHLLESDKAYRARLNALKKSLSTDFVDAHHTLHPNAGSEGAGTSENDPLGLGL